MNWLGRKAHLSEGTDMQGNIGRTALAAAAMLLALTACMKPRTNAQTQQVMTGSYDIDGTVGGVLVNGSLEFEQPLIHFVTNHGSCTLQYETFRPLPKPYLNLGCGTLRMRFSYRNGRIDDRAFATVTKTEVVGTRRVCVAWGLDANRRRVCLNYMAEPVERTTRKEAFVSVVPAAY